MLSRSAALPLALALALAGLSAGAAQQQVERTHVLRVKAQEDDAEENQEGWVTAVDDANLQLWRGHVGLRFRDSTVPPGAEIVEAHLVLTAQSSSSSGEKDEAKLPAIGIYGSTDDWPFYSDEQYDIKWRERSTPKRSWQADGNWVAGESYLSPNLRGLVQQLVNSDGYELGDGLVFVLKTDDTDRERREISSFDAEQWGIGTAPELHVTFLVDSTDSPTAGPTAGPTSRPTTSPTTRPTRIPTESPSVAVPGATPVPSTAPAAPSPPTGAPTVMAGGNSGGGGATPAPTSQTPAGTASLPPTGPDDGTGSQGAGSNTAVVVAGSTAGALGVLGAVVALVALRRRADGSSSSSTSTTSGGGGGGVAGFGEADDVELNISPVKHVTKLTKHTSKKLDIEALISAQPPSSL